MKVKKGQLTSLDTGYSWVVLLASTIIYAIVAGWAKTFGILYTEFIKYYGTGSGNTAWVGSVNSLFFFALGPLSNHLCEVYSFRSVIMFGGILTALGAFASAFVNQMEILYLTIGLIGGLGGGFVFTPACTIINFYFEKRRGLANAMMISGSGVGTFLFPYFYPYLIDNYGLQGTLMILSAIVANICVCSALYRQPSQLSSENSDEHKGKEHSELLETIKTNHESINDSSSVSDKICIDQKKETKSSMMNIFDFSLFRNPKMCSYVFAYTANTFGYISNYSVLPAYILSLGLTNANVSVALSVAGAAEILSKFFFGWLVDLKYFKIKHVLLMTFVVSGVAALAVPFFQNFIALTIYAGVVGVFAGSYFSLMAVVLLDAISMTQLPKGFGLTTLCMAFGAVLAQPIAGWIKDLSGSWVPSFRYIGAMNVLAAMFVMIQPCLSKCSNGTDYMIQTRNKQKHGMNTIEDKLQEQQDHGVQFITKAEIETNTPI